MIPAELSIGLKEWASVCSALQRGRQILLLRKGGIYESAGEFEVEHRSFLLFPTYLHQNLSLLKPESHQGFVPVSAEPDRVEIAAAAQVTDILQLQSRPQLDALDDLHIWTPPLIDMRFNYRPENPLYLLLVRVHRLPHPVSIENTPAYAGCKSWVPLEKSLDTRQVLPVLEDTEYNRQRSEILARLNPTRPAVRTP